MMKINTILLSTTLLFSVPLLGGCDLLDTVTTSKLEPEEKKQEAKKAFIKSYEDLEANITMDQVVDIAGLPTSQREVQVRGQPTYTYWNYTLVTGLLSNNYSFDLIFIDRKLYQKSFNKS